MQSGEVVALIVLAAIAVIVMIAFLSAQPNRPQWPPPIPTRQPRHSPVKSPLPSASGPPGSGLEAILGLVLLGMAGVALLKFIESGGLARLLNRIGDTPIEVNGRTTTIAAAVNDEVEIRRLLLEAVEKRLSALDSNGTGPTIDATNAAAATDIANMLRDAVGQRMRARGI